MFAAYAANQWKQGMTAAKCPGTGLKPALTDLGAGLRPVH
jgi:hypothetical protein